MSISQNLTFTLVLLPLLVMHFSKHETLLKIHQKLMLSHIVLSWTVSEKCCTSHFWKNWHKISQTIGKIYFTTQHLTYRLKSYFHWKHKIVKQFSSILNSWKPNPVYLVIGHKSIFNIINLIVLWHGYN